MPATRRAVLAGAAGLGAAALSGRVRAAGSGAPSLTWSRTYAPPEAERALVRDVGYLRERDRGGGSGTG